MIPPSLRSWSMLTLFLLFARPVVAEEPQEVRGPLSPARALEEFRVAPGLRVELVAAEPDVLDPVSIAFDEDLRLWVVEMPDYPNGPRDGQGPEGRIRILEDTNGDGQYDRNTLFADDLRFANGLLPWKGGAIVTAAPHIIYLKDTTGDGQADHREVLYEGFSTQNPQLQISFPTLGLDNWIYAANGLRGGKIVRAGQDNAEPIDISGMDFRFDLIQDRAEAISGPGQFGLAFDDWGRRFVCDNRRHLRHVVLPDAAIKRNAYLAVPSVLDDISFPGQGQAAGGATIYPLSQNWTTSTQHIGQFTAACGISIERGGLLPDEFQGNAFTCDPTGNLIHREIMEPFGASFQARPAREGVEFLATPDDWFRPVMIAQGPDGALYVVDMYRAVIEHPEFMPEELKDRPDLIDGNDRGRIWRIVPEDFDGPMPPLKLSELDSPKLVGLLAHPNAWWRTTAQRLLLQRQDEAAVEPLNELVRSAESPKARLHAAWLLDGLKTSNPEIPLQLLEDEHPRVREQAVRLASPHLTDSEPIQQRLIGLASDPDPRVRFEVALALGDLDDDRILNPLARIALQGADDRWTRNAVASSVPDRAGALIATLLSPEINLTAEADPGRLALLRELAALVGARRDPEEVAATLSALVDLDEAGQADDRWPIAALNGLADGLGRRGARLADFLGILPDAVKGPKTSTIVDRTGALLRRASDRAEDAEQAPDVRRDATLLLAHAPWEIAEPPLNRLLTDDPSQEIRLAAVRALAAHPRPEVADHLLKPWRSYLPAVRGEVAAAMLRRGDRIQRLLDAIEAGDVLPGDLDAASTRRLVDSSNAEIQTRARTLLRDGLPGERREVIKKYEKAITLEGDPSRGMEIFRQTCATCHRVADIGTDVGPDIADTRTKTKDALLTDILDPNQAIDGNYVNYIVATSDGQVYEGLIAAETASSITIRRAEGQEDILLRQDIEELRSTGLSLMPDGLEQDISVEQMADLLTFLKDWRYLDGNVPLRRESEAR
ncbi:hypothetical protein BH23PLA1_BH23PLA1_22710 [soil metagenome]